MLLDDDFTRVFDGFSKGRCSPDSSSRRFLLALFSREAKRHMFFMVLCVGSSKSNVFLTVL